MAERKKFIGINVTEEERERVHKLAKRRNYEITSDYLRWLIETDAVALGDNFKFEVDRGGYRERET